jgi:hypothetical protein
MFLKRYAALLAAPTLLMAFACQSTTSEQQPNQKLAAYAASVSFPGNTHAEDSTNVGAVVEPGKVVRIYNFGQNELDGSEVWLNASFVYKVDSMPGNGVVSLSLADFYDHDGHSFGDTNATVTTVQLHAGDHVWKLLGPINQ